MKMHSTDNTSHTEYFLDSTWSSSLLLYWYWYWTGTLLVHYARVWTAYWYGTVLTVSPLSQCGKRQLVSVLGSKRSSMVGQHSCQVFHSGQDFVSNQLFGLAPVDLQQRTSVRYSRPVGTGSHTCMEVLLVLVLVLVRQPHKNLA